MRSSQDVTHTTASPEPGTRAAPAAHTGAGVRIGVFDSGLGGLSVLKAIRAHLPDADLLYVADSGHAPYGERDESYIVDRADRISDFLVGQGVDALVVACNTATAAAVHSLRQRWGNIPVIGVEPGVKPAVQLSRSGRIGVLATPGTLGSEKFRRLVEQHAAHARLTLQPCPGLAKAIESGDLQSEEVREMVRTYATPLRQAGVDTVVLGCTHYPFVADQFQAALGPDVTLLDTAEAVALQTMRMTRHVHEQGRPSATPARQDAPPDRHDFARRGSGSATVRLWSTGEPGHLSRVAQAWLGWRTEAQAMPEAPL